jgi:dUTP pyrophosphatase
MYSLKIKYLDNYAGPEEGLSLPKEGDIGIDLYSAEDIEMIEGQTILLGTGISYDIPDGFWLKIMDRSSVSENLHALAGVLDTSYRGEVKLRLFCHSGNEEVIMFEGGHPQDPDTLPHTVVGSGYKISKGQKIAQMIIKKSWNSSFTLELAEELSETERGDGGFGSTGK